MRTSRKYADPTELGVAPFVHIRLFAASLGAAVAGTTLSWTSPALDHLQDPNSTSPYHATTEQASWIGSLLAVGALLAAIPSGIAADKFGRKYPILALTAPYALSWALVVNSGNIWTLYAGRLLAGTGIGGICTLAPMYIAEITEEATRGPICSLFPLLFSIGVMGTFVVYAWAEYYMLCYVLSVVPVLFGVSFAFMPESPKYLVKIGREKEAKEALHFLRGEFYDVNSEIMEMRRDVLGMQGEKATLAEILRDGVYRKSLVACIVLFVFQQLSGINAVIFYTVPIFKAANSSLDPLASSLLVTSVQVVVTVLVMYIIDRLGRKVYLLQSTVIMSMCLFLLGLYFHLKSVQIEHPLMDAVPLASLMVFLFTFSMGFGPIPWVVVGEINTPEIIGTVSGIAAVANWTSGFVVTKTFGPMLEAIGPHWTFYLYGFYNALGTVLVSVFVPETRFKTPHEVFAKGA